MSREEAILLLQDMKDTYDEIHENTNYEIGYEQMTAIDMAIEAIRHDVIFEQIKWERDVALDTLEEHGIGLGQKCDAEVVSAEAEWIPCSERLPSKDGCYLVSTTGTNNDIIDIAYYTEEIWHKASRIKAWMPLPDPYKEESEVEE